MNLYAWYMLKYAVNIIQNICRTLNAEHMHQVHKNMHEYAFYNINMQIYGIICKNMHKIWTNMHIICTHKHISAPVSIYMTM